MEETIVFKADNWRNPDCSDGGFCCRNDAGKRTLADDGDGASRVCRAFRFLIRWD